MLQSRIQNQISPKSNSQDTNLAANEKKDNNNKNYSRVSKDSHRGPKKSQQLKFKTWAAIKNHIKDRLSEGDDTTEFINYIDKKKAEIEKIEQLTPLDLKHSDDEEIISFDTHGSYLVVLSSKIDSEGCLDPSNERKIEIFNSLRLEKSIEIVLSNEEMPYPNIRFIHKPWGNNRHESGYFLNFYLFDRQSFLIFNYSCKEKTIHYHNVEVNFWSQEVDLDLRECSPAGFIFSKKKNFHMTKFFIFSTFDGSVGLSCIKKLDRNKGYTEIAAAVGKVGSNPITKAIGDDHYPLIYSAMRSTITVFRVSLNSSQNLMLRKVKKWTAHSSMVKDLIKFNRNHLISAAEGGAMRIWVTSFNGMEFRKTSRKESQRLLCFQKAFIDSIVHNSHYLVGLSSRNQVRTFSHHYNVEEKCREFTYFEAKYHPENKAQQIDMVRIDSKNTIYVLSQKRIKIWKKSYLVKEHNFENVLNEPEQVNGEDNPTNASIKRLEYAQAMDNCMLLCYSEIYSGNGRLSIWKPKPKGSSTSRSRGLASYRKRTSEWKLRRDSDDSDDNDGPPMHKLESRVNIIEGKNLNKVQWQFSTKFKETININGFTWSQNLKFIYLFEQTENVIIGYELDPSGVEATPIELRRIPAPTYMYSLAINETGEYLATASRDSVYFWDFSSSSNSPLPPTEKKKFEEITEKVEKFSKSSKFGGRRKNRQMSRMDVERGERRIKSFVKTDNATPDESKDVQSDPLIKENFTRIQDNGVTFMNGMDTVSVVDDKEVCIFKLEVKKNKLAASKITYNHSNFEDWEQGEALLHFSSDSNIVISGILDKYPQEHIVIRQLRDARFQVAMFGRGINSMFQAASIVNRTNRSKKKHSEAQYRVIQTLKFKDTKSHSVNYHVKEVGGILFLVAYFKGRGFSPYTEVYTLKRTGYGIRENQFIFVKKLDSDSGVCFNRQFSFIAYGSNQGKTEIMIKKNSYTPGELPQCMDLYEHLHWVFYGVKNTINPQYLVSLADYLKKNEFAFNDLIIHKEINILFLAVLSGSPDCLKTCLNYFGYKKNLYDTALGKNMTMDPLVKAIEMQDEGLLDTFSDYFGNTVIEDFNEDLFFMILHCQSLKLKHTAVEQFLTNQGDEKNVFISSTYPLQNNYEIISFRTNTRGMSFKRELQRRSSSRKVKQTSVDYFVSVFPVDFNLRSKFGTRFVEAMIEVEDEIMMTNLKYLILEMWETNYLFVFLYSVINLSAVILFFFWVSLNRSRDWMIYVVVPIFFVFLIMEFIVMFGNFSKYWAAKYNWIDMVMYLAIPGFMLFDRYGPEWGSLTDTNNTYNSFIITLMFVAFIRSLTMLRFWKETRYLVAMIFRAFSDIKSFIAILFLTVISFGLMHAQAFKTDREIDQTTGLRTQKFRPTKSFFEVIDTIFNYAFGNWGDTGDYNFTQYYSFLIFIVFLQLVMMNLFIAIIWDTYTNVRTGRKEADFNEILNILGEFNYLFKFFGLMGKKNISEKYIHMIKKKGDKSKIQEEREHQDLFNTIHKSQSAIERLERTLQEMIDSDEKLDDKVDKIEDKLAKMEKMIKRIGSSGRRPTRMYNSRRSFLGSEDRIVDLEDENIDE